MPWTDKEKREILDQLKVMVVSLGGEADPALFMGYAIGLDGLSVDQVKRACARALRQCKFIPKPAELRELSGEVSIDDRTLLAWDGLKWAIERVGGYRSIDFDDKVINAVVHHLGGWPHLCEQSTVVIDRDIWPRFARAYKAFMSRGSLSSSDASPALGIFAQENTLHGHDVVPPIAFDTGLGTKLAIGVTQSQGTAKLPSAALQIGVIE